MKLFLKNLLFTVIVPGTAAVYVPLIITRGKHVTTSPFLLVVSTPLLVFGTAIYTWTVWDFAVIGKGTPSPIDAPKTLVVRGLYRYTRNPMYLGVLMVILGWSGLFTNTWLVVYALGVWALVHLFVILYEERKLSQLFGVEYENYKKAVGRWIPHFPRGRSP